jgi:hypothetical protein
MNDLVMSHGIGERSADDRVLGGFNPEVFSIPSYSFILRFPAAQPKGLTNCPTISKMCGCCQAARAS